MRIQISAQRIAFPPVCCCCGRPADTTRTVVAWRTRGVRVIRTQQRIWQVPYFVACNAHIRAADWRGAPVGLAILVALAALFLWAWRGPVVAGLAFAGCVLLLVWLFLTIRAAIRRRQCPTCARAGMAVRYYGWTSSIHTFDLASLAYCRMFIDANASKIVNLTPEARRQLAP